MHMQSIDYSEYNERIIQKRWILQNFVWDMHFEISDYIY